MPTTPATTTAPVISSPTFGATLVRRLRMRMPDDPMMGYAQEAFTIMLVFSAPFAFSQAVLIMIKEPWTTMPTFGRVASNMMLAVVLSVALFTQVWHGRIRPAARLLSAAMLMYVTAYAAMFGLRGSPTPFAMTFGSVAALAIVESPRRLGYWGFAFGAVLLYALLVHPPYTFQPAPLTQITSVLWTFFVFVLYLSNFRRAISHAVESLSEQTTTLAATNADLHRTIAERDRLSRQLANSQRLEAMGRMAGSIAHDFNNLLTVIRGYTDLIAAETPASSPRRTEVELLTKAVARASGVTREVLDFASPHQITLERLDLSRFVRDLTPGFQRLLPPRVTLDIDAVSASCEVLANRAQLERLLLNLVTNARDVTPPGGRVRVSVAGNATSVHCRVLDGGPGVPPELRDRIFEPFFTTKGTTGGTGLGLASAYSIARQHHGALTVDDAVGGGAVFTLELPRATTGEIAATDDDVTPRASAPERKALSGVHVMLVEDDDAVRRLATRLLHRSGASVTAFDNGVDAVDYLTRESPLSAPNLIVTDLRLPRGSGAEVIDAAQRVTPDTALVAISGFLEDPVVADRAARGELRFLSKPFSEVQLLEAIDDARRHLSR